TRLPGGRGRDPLRVVLDGRLRTPPTARIINRDSPAATWIFCARGAEQARIEALRSAGVRVLQVERSAQGLDLRQVLLELGRAGVGSLLVEGGGRVHGSFLSQGLADEAAFFVAPLLVGGDGLPAVGPLGHERIDQAPRLREVVSRRLGSDILIRGLF
ncbi:MAG TPA: RibD family protein, partial [Desulfurivibrio alkaliphilus]|nr:RibD family protein [Desulfurivibrio alkaliphilus]